MNVAKKWLYETVDSLPDDMELDEAVEEVNHQHMVARHKASLKQYREQGGGISADEMRKEIFELDQETRRVNQ